MASDPLIFAEITKLEQPGKEVRIFCREPQPCMSGRIGGPTAVVNAGMERLEAIHQAAHALRDEVAS